MIRGILVVVLLLSVAGVSRAQERDVFHFDRPCTVEVRVREGRDWGPWMEEPEKGQSVRITRIKEGVFDLRATAECSLFTSYRAVLETQRTGDFNPGVIVLKPETRVDRLVNATWVVIIVCVASVAIPFVLRYRRRHEAELEARVQEAEAALARLQSGKTPALHIDELPEDMT